MVEGQRHLRHANNKLDDPTRSPLSEASATLSQYADKLMRGLPAAEIDEARHHPKQFLGTPFPVYSLAKDNLANLAEIEHQNPKLQITANAARAKIGGPPTYFFPVSKDDHTFAGIIVREDKDGKWHPQKFLTAAVAHSAVDVRNELKSQIHDAAYMEIPQLGNGQPKRPFLMIGRKTEPDYVPLADDPSLHLQKGVPIPAREMLKRLTDQS